MKHAARIIAVFLAGALLVAAGVLWLDHSARRERLRQQVRHNELVDKLERIERKVDEIDSQVRWLRHGFDRIEAGRKRPAGTSPDE